MWQKSETIDRLSLDPKGGLAMARGAAIIFEGRQVALIKRVRHTATGVHTYYLLPGGHIEAGETPEQATIREVHEELGLHVQLDRLIAVVEFRGMEQFVYLASVTGGQFGAGDGPEMASPPESARGSYTPVWMDCAELMRHDVRPFALAWMLSQGELPAKPVHIRDGQSGTGPKPAGAAPATRREKAR